MDFCKRDDLKFDYINATSEEKNKMLFKEHLINCISCRDELDLMPEIAENLKTINVPEVNNILVQKSKENILNVKEKEHYKNLFSFLIYKTKKLNFLTYSITSLLFFVLFGSVFFFSNSTSIKELFNNFFGSTIALQLDSLNNIYQGLGQLVGISLLLPIFFSLLLMPSIIENIYILFIGKSKNLKFFEFV